MRPPAWWTDGFGARQYVIADYPEDRSRIIRGVRQIPKQEPWIITHIEGEGKREWLRIENVRGERLRVPKVTFWRGWRPVT